MMVIGIFEKSFFKAMFSNRVHFRKLQI
jgi:hypothetical protein